MVGADDGSSTEPVTPALLQGHTLVDLSHGFDASTIYWPTSPSQFQLESLFAGQTDAGFDCSTTVYSVPEHGGPLRVVAVVPEAA